MMKLEREITPILFGGLRQGPLYLIGHLIGQNKEKRGYLYGLWIAVCSGTTYRCTF